MELPPIRFSGSNLNGRASSLHRIYDFNSAKTHKMDSPHRVLVTISTLVFLFSMILTIRADPTDGFTQLPLSSSNFQIQKPYNVPQGERYTFINGVHRFRVFSTDKPFMENSPTKPRTEIHITGYDYSSGVWQFEGQAYVPSGTTGTCIMQVFGGDPTATTLMLRVYDGSLTYYRSPVVLPNVYDRWFRVNVIHDVGRSKLQVYIDGVLKEEFNGRGGDTHYFKVGVYTQDNESNYMESRWRGLKVLRK